MSDNLQQLAEQLLNDLQPNDHRSWWDPSAKDVVIAALQSAARQGQREALNQAAHDAATSGFVNADGFPVDVSGDVIALWLRARASALEGGTK